MTDEQNITAEQAFQQGFEEAESELNNDIEVHAAESTDDNPNEITVDHLPGDDDSDDYWKAFAESKGWTDNREKVKEGFFTDYKAFVKNHERIEANRSSRSEISELKKTVEETARQTGELTRMQREKHNKEVEVLKEQLESAKIKAKADLDFEAYEKADGQLKKIEEVEAEPAQQDAKQEHPFIASWRADHPEVDRASESFDPDLNQMVELKVNQAITSGQVKNEHELLKFMNDAIESTKTGLVRYQKKPERKPPATNKVKGNPSAAADPGRLDAQDRSYYNYLVKKGQLKAAELFMKESLGV